MVDKVHIQSYTHNSIYTLVNVRKLSNGCLLNYYPVSQENSLVIRYDFSEKSSPSMIPFYLGVYVNNILIDSTTPHSPNHNLANAIRINIEKGDHEIRIQGITMDKREKLVELTR